MYIPMNGFQVQEQTVPVFEDHWLKRNSSLSSMDGFVEFQKLRGVPRGHCQILFPHTTWESDDVFRTSNKSVSFRDAHRDSSRTMRLHQGYATSVGFKSIQRDHTRRPGMILSPSLRSGGKPEAPRKGCAKGSGQCRNIAPKRPWVRGTELSPTG